MTTEQTKTRQSKIDYRAGYLGLIGQPNAGKSSLLNFLISEKISIVTNKPQTTRRRVIGVHSTDHGQIVFVDAPGMVKSTSGLNSFLQKEAEEVIQSSDALVAVLSIDESDAARNEEIIDLASRSKKPWIGIVTKTDISEKSHRILILKDMIRARGAKALQISNTKSDSNDRHEILAEMMSILPLAEAPLFDTELYTTESMRNLAEEIIREKCFEILNFEIPYQLAVQTRKFDEDAKPCPKLYIDILVARDSHKPIVVGKAGANIKKIGEESRKEIQKMMGIDKVYLELNVVVKDNWYENKTTMKELKYVTKSE
jgi:GTP-binding protein Era